MGGINVLGAIKKDIEGHVGEMVVLKANSGRRKIVVEEGILEKTYENIFVIRVAGEQQRSRMLSYSYSDILTQTVEIVYKNNVAM